MRARPSSISFTLCRTIMGVLVLGSGAAALAQTPGGTTIHNQVTATYSDGSTSYSTTSNIVTVTVSDVSGLSITPDAGTNPTVVAGQTSVDFIFTLTNTGNFTDKVRFEANGASIVLTGPGAVTDARIDVDNSNTINGGDTDIFGNGAAVQSADIAQNGTIKVIVRVSVNAGASAGAVINVQLGDASTGASSYDNQAASSSANEVRTVSTSSVNGLREARGDINATVQNDAQLRLSLTAPSGPVSLGSDITYTWQLANIGARDASAQTLSSNTGVYIVAPIPGRTVLKSGQTFPAGTLYTTTALTTAPLLATWTTSAPGDLATVTRIAFKTGDSLASGASSSTIDMIVTIQSGVDATNSIKEIGDAFVKNSLAANLTDQSGDSVANVGDGNANFTEGSAIGSIDGDGVPQATTLTSVGGVLLGPSSQPGAVGPINVNDDYTNRSINTGIAGVAPGGTTTASGTVTFTNTIQNTGNANDTYTITAPSVPAGFTVEASTDGGSNYSTISGGGSATVAVTYGSTADILVRITCPSGNTVLSAYSTSIRATSTNTGTTTNDTIDRLYTGFMQLDKAQSVTNGSGVGSATDPVPAAEIAYTATYRNLASSGGTNNSTLTASGIVLTDPVPSNTDFKVSSATSTPPGGITVSTSYSNDNGSTFTYTPASGAGGAPAGYDRSVTHVRFTLTGSLSPSSTGTAGFTVRIR